MPNAAGIQNGDTPFYFAGYARNNKLPYTMNSSLDIQWQPRNDLAIDIGAVDALGRHEIIPVPFNQARIATPTNQLKAFAAVCPNPSTALFPQSYTYGYTVQTAAGCGFLNCTLNLPNNEAADRSSTSMAATLTNVTPTSAIPLIRNPFTRLLDFGLQCSASAR